MTVLIINKNYRMNSRRLCSIAEDRVGMGEEILLAECSIYSDLVLPIYTLSVLSIHACSPLTVK